MAGNGEEMQRHLGTVLNDSELAQSLATNGIETIRTRHTCAHRVDELLDICAALRLRVSVSQEMQAQEVQA